MTIKLKSSPCDRFFKEARRAGIPVTEALAGKDLSGYNLSGYNLSKFNLTSTVFNGSDLSHAKLNGANLQNAVLRGVVLTKAILCGCNLSDADLSGADMRRADLSGAIIKRAKLNNAKLSEIDLSGTDVRDAKFSQSLGLAQSVRRKLERQGADFGSANLINSGKELKWWIEVVIVPVLIALIGIFVYKINGVERENFLIPNLTTLDSERFQ